MNLIGRAIRQPVTVTVGVILIVVSGLLALQRIPIQLTPNVESTIITVQTVWDNRAEPLPHLRDGGMQAAPQGLLQLLQLAAQPLAHRPPS